MLKTLILKANSIAQFRVKLASLNYQNLRKIDIRNNKIKMSLEQVSRFADKLKKFQQLRLFNMEENSGIDLSGDAYIKLIKSLPKSLEMFNNQRKIYLLREVQDELLKRKKHQLQRGKAGDEGAAGEGDVRDALDDADDDELPFNQEIPPDPIPAAEPEPAAEDQSLTESARQRMEEELQAYEVELDHKFRNQNAENESDYD